MEPIRAEQRKLVGGEIIFLMVQNGRKASALKGKRVVGVKSIKLVLASVKIQKKTKPCLQKMLFYSNTKEKSSTPKMQHVSSLPVIINKPSLLKEQLNGL